MPLSPMDEFMAHQTCETFDRVFVSSEMGLRKPEPEAFLAIAKATEIPLASTLFFDDSIQNVEAARATGLPAVHVRSSLDVKQALVELDVAKMA